MKLLLISFALLFGACTSQDIQTLPIEVHAIDNFTESSKPINFEPGYIYIKANSIQELRTGFNKDKNTSHIQIMTSTGWFHAVRDGSNVTMLRSLTVNNSLYVVVYYDRLTKY